MAVVPVGEKAPKLDNAKPMPRVPRGFFVRLARYSVRIRHTEAFSPPHKPTSFFTTPLNPTAGEEDQQAAAAGATPLEAASPRHPSRKRKSVRL